MGDLRPPRPEGDTLPAMDSDEELLRRLRAGDERGFVDLVERHNGAMLRLALSFVSSRAVAEEVVQDTWLAALRGLGAFEGRSSLKTWLFTILVNRARTTGVREARSVPIADAGPAVDASRFGPSGGWAVPPEHWIEEAEDRIDAVKLSELLRIVLDTLPAEQQGLLELAYFKGLSHSEIAQQTGSPLGTVKTRIRAGLTTIRKAMNA